MTDLTAITTPFGLLDKETQERLRAHGGPYERYSDSGEWMPCPRHGWYLGDAYRVKPQPPKPREWWIANHNVLCTSRDAAEAERNTFDPDGEIIHVREVLE